MAIMTPHPTGHVIMRLYQQNEFKEQVDLVVEPTHQNAARPTREVWLHCQGSWTVLSIV